MQDDGDDVVVVETMKAKVRGGLGCEWGGEDSASQVRDGKDDNDMSGGGGGGEECKPR
jgi:hypothetical protein